MSPDRPASPEPQAPSPGDPAIRGLLRIRRAEAAALASARRVEQLEGELRELEQLAASPPADAGRGPQPRLIRERDPAAFEDLVRRCGGLLDLALRRQRLRAST